MSLLKKLFGGKEQQSVNLKSSGEQFVDLGKSKDQRIAVDGVYLLEVPNSWSHFDSDRFRMKTADESVQFSATNYAKDGARLPTINDLKGMYLPLFDKFVNEGGFISNNNLEIGKDFVYQSFKVDDETQHYYYTARARNNREAILVAFVLREQGECKTSTTKLLKNIGANIMMKVG